MAELVVNIPKGLEKEIRALPENWSKVALEAIRLRAFELEIERSKKLRNALLGMLASKSKLTEEGALKLGRLIKKGRFKKLK